MENLFTRNQTKRAPLFQEAVSGQIYPSQATSFKNTKGLLSITGCIWILVCLLINTNVVSAKKASINAAPPLAAFSIPDTIWINSPVTFLNNSTDATQSYWDITAGLPTPPARICNVPNVGCFMVNSVNFNTKFPQSGYYDVKLFVTNSSGSSQITKTVFVMTPTTPPTADFIFPKDQYFELDSILPIDMSTGGVVSWNWTNEITNPVCNGFDCFDFLIPSLQNPILQVGASGDYKICLKATNSVGSTTICKTVNAIKPNRICSGGSLPKDVLSTELSGYLTDIGGASVDYRCASIKQCGQPFFVIPCADSIFLEILQFSLAPGATDHLIITDGPSATAPVIADLTGPNMPAITKYRLGKGGIMIKHTSTLTDASKYPGFLIRWTTSTRTYGVGSPDFVLADTVYDGTSAILQNTSTGVRLTPKWDTNNDGYYGDENYLAYDSISISPNMTFINKGDTIWNRRFCLKVVNCVGSTVKCKTTAIIPVVGAPTAGFTINTNFGFTEDTFKLADKSLNGAVKWDWSISPSYFRFTGGTTSKSKNPSVMFDYPGYYKIQLIVTNPLNLTGTITKDSFVNILSYDVPSSKYPLSGYTNDVGITKVKINDLDVSTNLKTPQYDFDPGRKTTLYRGGKYAVSVFRPTAVSSMNRKVWVDLNRNAVFESSEQLITENATNTLSATDTLRIPLDAPIGTLRMRVGASVSTANLTASSTNLGCYEDYGIVIGVDQTPPTIDFNGDSIIYIEVNKSYTDSGIVATDNIEGNISNRVVIEGLDNLDLSTVGYYTLQYYVDDSYGNRSRIITRLVNVVINGTGPTLTLNTPTNLNIEVNNPFSDPGFQAKDNLGNDIHDNVVVTGEVDITKTGTYTLVYSITDAFDFTATAERTVVVSDTTKPVVHPKSSGLTYNLQIGETFTTAAYATDNYDKSPDLSYQGAVLNNEKGTYTLIYSATDLSGNVSDPVSIDVKVDDFVPPTLRLIGGDIMTIKVHEVEKFATIDPGVSDSDNYYTTVELTSVSNVNTHVVGVYTVTYTAKDGSGNITQVTRTVKVVDTEAPVISLRGVDPFLHPRFQEYKDAGVFISDNYYTNDTLQKLKVVVNNVPNDVPGQYYVVYNVTDPSGNRANTVKRLVIVSEDGTTGVDEINNNANIHIYPNPTRGLITVSLGEESVKSISVYNNVGELVLQKQCYPNTLKYELDLSENASGIYFIRIEGENGVRNQKVNLVK